MPKPFRRGQSVVCTSNFGTSLKLRQVYTVESCKWGYRAKDWVVTLVEIPNVDGFQARRFRPLEDFGWIFDPRIGAYTITDHETYGDYIQKERAGMYIAIDITDDPKLQKLDVKKFNNSTIVGIDKSMDLLKDTIQDYVKRYNATVAVFNLVSIAELESTPVRFRDMR